MSRTLVLNLVMLQSIVSMITIPIAGHLSDVYGRRKIIGIGCVIMLIFPFVYFSMIDTKIVALIALAIVLGLPSHDLQYGPQGAFIAESFPGSVRYSGAGLGYQLASITAGGPAPIIAVLLYGHYRSSMAIAIYIAISALVSLICLAVLKDKTGLLDEK